jgi:hypothetical protein
MPRCAAIRRREEEGINVSSRRGQTVGVYLSRLDYLTSNLLGGFPGGVYFFSFLHRWANRLC